jgi:predicted nuclease with TOPRIM domain
MLENFISTPDNLAELATAIVVAIIAGVFTIQKLMKNWKETATETSVIKLVNEQMEIMSSSNKMLSTELTKLHAEIIKLNRELRTLSEENERLHKEVTSLTEEVTRLQLLLKIE